jgi:hypothetical protein
MRNQFKFWRAVFSARGALVNESERTRKHCRWRDPHKSPLDSARHLKAPEWVEAGTTCDRIGMMFVLSVGARARADRTGKLTS